jgi:NAD+ diphosphatase
MPEPAPNTFAGARLDRAGPRRRDTGWLEARLADPASRALVVTRQGVYLSGEDGDRLPSPGADADAPRDARSWDPDPGGRVGPALVPLADLAGLAPLGPPLLLGLADDGAALFAVDADAAEREAVDAALGASGAGLAGVRDAAARLGGDDAGLVAYATAMLNWHRRHGFCANCGAPTEVGEAGFVRTCPRCGASHHPRTDPVVIMLVVDGDRVLMGRQPTWPEHRYSALAGFVEPGESLEAAVAREVLEESGVEIAEPRYASSQPWPFPASLMLGFTARYAGGEPVAVDGELEDVRWFERAELESSAAGDGPIRLPPPMAIARRLVDDWLARG